MKYEAFNKIQNSWNKLRIDYPIWLQTGWFEEKIVEYKDWELLRGDDF
jgi:hypothetical protein